MDRRGFILAALALGGCATVGTPSNVAPSAGPLGELEPLYAVQPGRGGLTIRVASHGCTARPDFAFYVERRGDTVGVAFARRHVDACKSAAQPAEIAFSWSELGIEPHTPIFLLNPIAPPAG